MSLDRLIDPFGFGLAANEPRDPGEATNAPMPSPEGEAAVAVHRGPYHRVNEAHDAIRKWMTANGREPAGQSWEIYGDPTPNPADTETTVFYLLQ